MAHIVHAFQLCAPIIVHRFLIVKLVGLNFVNFISMHKILGVILCSMIDLHTSAKKEDSP